jgi:hypothetical protein
MGGVSVTQVSGCGTVVPPPITDPERPPDNGEKDPWKAIGKIAMQGGYCSGTVVAPRREDGRYRIVSAAHCFKQVGERASFIQRDGTARPITVIAIDRRADIAICSTETGQGAMASTDISLGTPPVGHKIWHGGYGRHLPGNKEVGTVLSSPNADNQVKYRLSVSPGDSGGGIITDDTGALLSPVCCTTRLDGPGEVWGGSPEKIRQMIATPTDYIDLPPMEMPPPPVQMPAVAPK